MKTKGSQRHKEAKDIELQRTLLEFTEKLELDPYSPNTIHQHMDSDDVADIIEDLLFVRNFNNFTIKIEKEENSYNLKLEILNRSYT